MKFEASDGVCVRSRERAALVAPIRVIEARGRSADNPGSDRDRYAWVLNPVCRLMPEEHRLCDPVLPSHGTVGVKHGGRESVMSASGCFVPEFLDRIGLPVCRFKEVVSLLDAIFSSDP